MPGPAGSDADDPQVQEAPPPRPASEGWRDAGDRSSNWKNKTVRTLELDPEVFDYPLKQHLIYEAVWPTRPAGRRGTHKTKNRVEVSGGTRKVWRQKGTGRARVGDNRSPLWRHGGTVHGPQPRDYSWNFPQDAANALRSALAQKLRDGKLVCLDKRSSWSRPRRGAGTRRSAATWASPRRCCCRSRTSATSNWRRATTRGSRWCARWASASSICSSHDTVVISEDALQEAGSRCWPMKNLPGHRAAAADHREVDDHSPRARGVYCFKVHDAGEQDRDRRAIEKLFAKDKVKVGRCARAGPGQGQAHGPFHSGKRPDWKKAWVRLTPDSGEIEFFEAS